MNNLSRLLMSSALCTVCTVASAQQVNLNGIVKDAAGETVIGASVMVKGTKTGTVTDFDGNFHVECAPGSTLVISYIGYKTQEVKASDNMEVTLQEDANDLQEVVVTGYTTQKKADLTGSVAVVSTKNLKTSSETDPMRALQGRVPGMTVTTDGSPIGSGTVRIRGIGSFNSSQDPLYIIDGVPTTMALNTLNTNDIESMQVLKDAASASIYGSRASNGVIIITTKKGKKGSKVAVDFSANLTAQFYSNQSKIKGRGAPTVRLSLLKPMQSPGIWTVVRYPRFAFQRFHPHAPIKTITPASTADAHCFPLQCRGFHIPSMRPVAR